MTDRYQEIRDALAMEPTPGPRRVIDGDSHPYVTVALPENEGHRWDDPIVCALYEDVTPDDYIGFGARLQTFPNASANAALIAACDPDTIRDLLAENAKLREALEEIRSRSAMNLAMNPNPFELTAMLGDIHQIADAALAKENGND